MFLEFRGAVAEEFHKGNTNRLPFIAKPSCLNKSRQFLGDLFRQIDIYGFHSNPILGDRTLTRLSRSAGRATFIMRFSMPYCMPKGCHFSPFQ